MPPLAPQAPKWDEFPKSNQEQTAFCARFKDYEAAGLEGEALLSAIRQNFTPESFTHVKILSNYELYHRTKDSIRSRGVEVPTSINGNNNVLIRLLSTIWPEPDFEKGREEAYSRYLSSRKAPKPPPYPCPPAGSSAHQETRAIPDTAERRSSANKSAENPVRKQAEDKKVTQISMVTESVGNLAIADSPTRPVLLPSQGYAADMALDQHSRASHNGDHTAAQVPTTAPQRTTSNPSSGTDRQPQLAPSHGLQAPSDARNRPGTSDQHAELGTGGPSADLWGNVTRWRGETANLLASAPQPALDHPQEGDGMEEHQVSSAYPDWAVGIQETLDTGNAKFFPVREPSRRSAASGVAPHLATSNATQTSMPYILSRRPAAHDPSQPFPANASHAAPPRTPFIPAESASYPTAPQSHPPPQARGTPRVLYASRQQALEARQQASLERMGLPTLPQMNPDRRANPTHYQRPSQRNEAVLRGWADPPPQRRDGSPPLSTSSSSSGRSRAIRDLGGKVQARYRTKDKQFGGGEEENWARYLARFENISDELELNNAQRVRYIHYALKDDAEAFYYDNLRTVQNWGEMRRMLGERYNSYARRQHISDYLRNVRLDEFTDNDTPEKEALQKLARKIEALTPQAPEGENGDRDKLRHLHFAVRGYKWARGPIDRLASDLNDYKSFLDALQKAEQNIRFEKRDRSLGGNPFSVRRRIRKGKPGSAEVWFAGQARYGRDPRAKRVPRLSDVKDRKCYNCGASDHLVGRCKQGRDDVRIVENRVKDLLRKRSSDDRIKILKKLLSEMAAHINFLSGALLDQRGESSAEGSEMETTDDTESSGDDYIAENHHSGAPGDIEDSEGESSSDYGKAQDADDGVRRTHLSHETQFRDAKCAEADQESEVGF